EHIPVSLRSLKISDCSGGQKQKVLMLTRLQTQGSVLILDEPFNHVDDSTILELIEFFIELISAETLKAIIVVSHIDIPEKFKQHFKVYQL
ncbi:hypothetical protein N9N67_12475, partial [Bacteriovoracaceae bacterium]|nr:hypothetical protein [Bacteriovoracaceae bacterium]